MPLTKRRKTNNKAGSRPDSRAATPVPSIRSSSPDPGTLEGPRSTNKLNPPLVLTSEKSRGVYECDYCHSDISRLPRIRCADCVDFDLCLECFLTTDHTSAIARLKAAVEARTAVDNLNAGGGHHVQHQGKQAPLGSSAGGGDTSSTAVSSAWHTGAGAINHDESHGYRVCDNTRYPLFPNPLKVRVSQVKGNPEDRGDNDVKIDGDEERLTLIPDDPKAIWTVEEDLRLLDGIEVHGLGNWVDIAEAVGGLGSSGKTPKRCMERYFDEFLGRYGRILPPYTLVEDDTEEKEDGDGNTSTIESNEGVSTEVSGGGGGSVVKDLDPTRLSKRRHCINIRTSSSACAQPFHRFNNKLKAVRTESLPEYTSLMEAFPPRVPQKDPPVTLDQRVQREEAARHEKQFVQLINAVSKPVEEQIRKDWKETKYMKPGGPTVLPERPEDVVKLPGAELAGFMPRRGDFDIEWENDAETALADMEFLPGDLPEDKKLKLQVLQIYNEKLDEREKRKNFILSRNLHDYRKNQEADSKLPRDERDLVRRMRLFERFHTSEEHKQFIDDVLKAKRLRKEIAKFQMYRRMGISTLAEAERYELDKSRRNFHKITVLNKESTPGKSPAPGVATEASAATATISAKKAADQQLWRDFKEPSGRRRSSTGRSQDGIPFVSESSALESKAGRLQETKAEEGNSGTVTDSACKKTGGVDQKDEFGANAGGFAIEEMEGFRYLSEKEAKLCRKIQLSPKEYMEVKKTLIHESLRHGLLDKEGSRRTIVNIDVEKREEVIDFMVQAAWLPKKGCMTRTISE